MMSKQKQLIQKVLKHLPEVQAIHLLAGKYLKIPFYLQLLLLASGCATLPEYARPRRVSLDREMAVSSQEFSYRELKKADFRALSLPQDLSGHEKQIQAHSCIQIRPTKDTQYRIVPNKYRQQIYYFGSIRHIAFEAFMFPSCSWWNPQMPKKRTAYVLEHEQIHFAITELAARKLTHNVREVTDALLVIQPTRKQAVFELSTQINALIKDATDESLKKHTAFDEDTSVVFNPKQQRRWLDRVNKMMRKTKPK